MRQVNLNQCRTCGEEIALGVNSPTFPFCSKRCKMVDLGHWMSGEYSISEPLIDSESEELADSEFEP